VQAVHNRVPQALCSPRRKHWRQLIKDAFSPLFFNSVGAWRKNGVILHL
jgi:hypothetical protein